MRECALTPSHTHAHIHAHTHAQARSALPTAYPHSRQSRRRKTCSLRVDARRMLPCASRKTEYTPFCTAQTPILYRCLIG